ncbi:hypothetical protein ALC62_00006, partial [Cyphomyrmex costatus]
QQPPVYFLRDLHGEDIDGLFYKEELTRIHRDYAKIMQNLTVEKIIRSKGRDRSRRILVSWHDFLENFNTWINPKNIKNFLKKRKKHTPSAHKRY